MKNIRIGLKKVGAFFSVPANFTRLIISLMILGALVCGLFPLVSIVPDSDNLVGSLLGSIGFEGFSMNGKQFILAPFSNDTIYPGVNIGPLPSNPYIIVALVFGVAALVMLWMGAKHRRLNLLSSLFSLVSAASLIALRPRFAPYYSTYTKNGGDTFQHYYDSGFFSIEVTPALVLAVIFFFFAFMAIMMLGEMLARPFSYSEIQD